MSRIKKLLAFGVGGLAGLALIVLLAALVTVQTEWFKNNVRDRIVSTAETATGGRVEAGRFDYNWHNLTAEIAPFVIHGKEPAQDAPFFRAERIRVGLRIISMVEQRVDLVSLTVEKPHIRVIVNPDGSTNIPEPKVRPSKKNLAEQLLDLKVRHFELHDGFANSRIRSPIEDTGWLRSGRACRRGEESDPSAPGKPGWRRSEVRRRWLHPRSRLAACGFQSDRQCAGERFETSFRPAAGGDWDGRF
jgi:translocation and assembly module TamB